MKEPGAHKDKGENPSDAQSPARPRALPLVLQSIRSRAKSDLAELLNNLFNNADDALFELADRASSNQEQNRYFDCMRELRLQRQSIQQLYLENLVDGFNPQADSASNTPEEPEQDTELSLLKNDELEVSVALSGMVSKATSQFSLAVMQLTKRMAHCYPEIKITERNNPVGPNLLARHIVQATECLDVDIQVRIIFLKLFERYVLEHLGRFYESANQLFIDANILPDLRRRSQVRSDNPRPAQGNRQSALTASHRDNGERLPANADFSESFSNAGSTFGALQQLLHAVIPGNAAGFPHGEHGHTASGSGILGATSGLDAGPIAQAPTPVLLSALNQIQSKQNQAPINPAQLPPQMDWHELVLSSVANLTNGAKSSLTQGDDDTVNLVAMLFDYILNDKNLAIPMKALIARLQIPIIKVAIVDKSFFEKTSHPARLLLNELSSAGIGWSNSSELKRDALYDRIESMVYRVVNYTDEDLNFYSALVNELREYLAKDHQRQSKAEQRVREGEKGKAKSEAAKRLVQQIINQKASGLRMPAEIGRFISDIWSRALVFICVRYSTESQNWQNATLATDDLLWCAQPLNSQIDLQARERKLPELFKSLEQALAHLNQAEDEVRQELSSLKQALNEIAENDRAYLEEDVEPPQDLEEMEELVLTTQAVSEPHVRAQVLPEVCRAVDALSEGIWVEFTSDQGDKTRGKLATIIEPDGKYIFVNRRGMKIAEYAWSELAQALEDRSLTILDESQVFDRALQSVIGNLRQMHRRNNNTP